MQITVQKIVSGGQTGADRAAWDFALEKKWEIGGFVPRNRWAEDGPISEKYRNLRETKSDDPAERTKLNVINSDATLILSHGNLSGGSKLTFEIAQKLHKPVLHVDFNETDVLSAVRETQNWLASNEVRVLNVAGPRASEDELIYEKTRLFLTKVFALLPDEKNDTFHNETTR